MTRKVGIVEVAQLSGKESSDLFVDQIFQVCSEVLNKANLNRENIGTVVSASSDAFNGGVSCANAYYWDAGAGLMKNGSRNDGESLTSIVYAAMRIATGHYDTALVFGVCKGSENPETDMLTHFFTDPFYQRQIGLNETVAAGMQMRMYLEKYGVNEEQCAKVVKKNLKNALFNPYAHKKGIVSVEQVIKSQTVMDPLKSMEIAPKSEGFVSFILAEEETAKKLTKNPIWIKGFGTGIDNFFIGDRNLLDTQLNNVAKTAYKMADIKNPKEEIDFFEICEPYAFQELLWCEELGLCEKGKGGSLIDSGITDMEGKIPVNPSGGVLSMNPYSCRGLYRLAEVVLQLKGNAGEHQIDKKVKTGLAHGCLGFAGQSQAVMIMEN